MGPLADYLLDQGDARGEEAARLNRNAADNLPAFWRLFGLEQRYADYLKKFSRTRRMKRDARKARKMPDPIRVAAGLPLGPQAAYFVGGLGYAGQDRDESVVDGNLPPKDQPGLWCKWAPTEDRSAIAWDGGEKFYDYIPWLRYLMKHFLAPWGYLLNGTVTWQGEREEDQGTIRVSNNAIGVSRY
jgi:hypothetical protein